MKQTPIIPMLKFQQGTLPLKIQTITNFLEKQDDASKGPHTHNYYEMIWVTSGKGTLEADMQKYIIERNTIFCLKPHEVHQIHVEPGTEGFVFSFADSFFGTDEYDFDRISHVNLAHIFNYDRKIKLPDEIETDMKEIVIKMIRELGNEHSYKMELSMRYFKIFIIHLTRWIGDSMPLIEQSREKDLVKSFLERLDNNFKEKKMVADYAELLLVDANYLSRIVKKITGFSAGHHIRQRLVLEAKRMCRYSAAGMKEIAYSLGFFDSAHFSRFFKSFAGVNFSEFKRQPVFVPVNA